MFAPIVGLLDKEVILTGEGSMITRPITMVEDALKEAAKTVKNIRGVHVKRCTARVEDNKIVEYRADVKVSFIVKR